MVDDRIGVSWWTFLLVLTYPGSSGQRAIKWLLLSLLLLFIVFIVLCICHCTGQLNNKALIDWLTDWLCVKVRKWLWRVQRGGIDDRCGWQQPAGLTDDRRVQLQANIDTWRHSHPVHTTRRPTIHHYLLMWEGMGGGWAPISVF